MQRRQSSSSQSSERQLILEKLIVETIDDNELNLYVITINGLTQNITIKWLLDLLETPDPTTGQHFSVKRISAKSHANCVEDIVLYVSASNRSLNVSADAIDLKQLRPNESFCRLFRIDDHRMASEECLTISEKQRVLLYQIEALHTTERGVVFGYPNVKLYPGQSIIQVCQRQSIVTEYFPLHEPSDLHQLKTRWCFSFKRQPIHDIRNYFGEKIAFYFAFLEYYTNHCLLIPALVGVFQYLFLNEMNIFCAVFYMLWIPVVLKHWKRRSNELAFKWGTIEDVLLEGPRPTFRGKYMETDPITKNPTPIYPIYKTWFREYGVSLPIVLLCLGIAFHVMCLYFRLEEDLINYCKTNSVRNQELFVLIPGIIYALIVMAMNHIYRQIATKLNEWENHRTQTSHENHWIIKLVLFEFVNNFMSLFYIAFYLKDIQMLKWQLGTMLIVNQLVDNVQEVLIPLIKTYRINKNFETNRKKSDLLPTIERINYERQLPSYEGTYYDYLELYIQFGYVFLFLTVFPLAPIIAFCNNYIEIRFDAIKLCYGYKRPHQRSAKSINGSWMKAFEVMAVISVITNCALLSLSPTVRSISQTFMLNDFQLMVVSEHFILAVILMISYIVPDVSKSVNVALIKNKYENQKIKIESTLQSRVKQFD